MVVYVVNNTQVIWLLSSVSELTILKAHTVILVKEKSHKLRAKSKMF